jgi:hypothetical protein
MLSGREESHFEIAILLYTYIERRKSRLTPQATVGYRAISDSCVTQDLQRQGNEIGTTLYKMDGAICVLLNRVKICR